jgi:hypothetical protein
MLLLGDGSDISYHHLPFFWKGNAKAIATWSHPCLYPECRPSDESMSVQQLALVVPNLKRIALKPNV